MSIIKHPLSDIRFTSLLPFLSSGWRSAILYVVETDPQSQSLPSTEVTRPHLELFLDGNPIDVGLVEAPSQVALGTIVDRHSNRCHQP